MNWLKKALYPIFGVVVLLSYAHYVRAGIEPLEVSSDQREIPTGPTTRAGTTSPRRHTVIWFGGFGGK